LYTISHQKPEKPLPVLVIGIGSGFEHRVQPPEVAEKFFSKVLKISRFSDFVDILF